MLLIGFLDLEAVMTRSLGKTVGTQPAAMLDLVGSMPNLHKNFTSKILCGV